MRGGVASRFAEDGLQTAYALKALYIVLFFFVGLTFTSKDGRDRWIYGAFAIATILVLAHYHLLPQFYEGHWRF